MLTFVFGAGASFDSDPQRRPWTGAGPGQAAPHRPPLAKELFSPQSALGRQAAADFHRARPLLMLLRSAAEQGRDIEQELERLESLRDGYSEGPSQSLALRAYLAQLLSDVPNEWSKECQGLTNYVLAVDAAARWSEATEGNPRVSFITFNYDLLLEDAVLSTYGTTLNHIDAYVGDPRFAVFKPHGSVNWRQDANWGTQSTFSGKGALHYAIHLARILSWQDEFNVAQGYQRGHDSTVVMLPALMIPVQQKAEFMMPSNHKAAMAEALAQTATLIAVGWRGRELHFLRELQDHLPSRMGRLVVVAESEEAAMETVDNLWHVGRFGSYATCTGGFTGFLTGPVTVAEHARRQRGANEASLSDVLEDKVGIWTERQPGRGLRDGVNPFADDPSLSPA